MPVTLSGLVCQGNLPPTLDIVDLKLPWYHTGEREGFTLSRVARGRACPFQVSHFTPCWRRLAALCLPIPQDCRSALHVLAGALPIWRAADKTDGS